MRKLISVQFIEKQGKPEWAVMPYKEYLRLKELDDISINIHAFKKALERGEEELIPADYAKRLIQGENPIRVWREYRKLNQATLATEVGISVPYLSQLEHAQRTASMDILKKIATALNITLNDLA